jgi:hypothetical protein
MRTVKIKMILTMKTNMKIMGKEIIQMITRINLGIKSSRVLLLTMKSSGRVLTVKECLK